MIKNLLLLFPAALILIFSNVNAQLNRVNSTDFAETIFHCFEENNMVYVIYQKTIHADQFDFHLLSLSADGIETNALLLRDTINELYVLHTQFHQDKFYIFYDAFAVDGSKKAWFKLGIFDIKGNLLSSQTLDTTNMEDLDSYVINNTVVFSPVKGTHNSAFVIDPNTFSVTQQQQFLPLFGSGYSLLYDDKANKKLYYYYFKNTFKSPGEFLEIASLDLNDTTFIKWKLDPSKFNLSHEIDIRDVRETKGDTIVLLAETYTDTIVHEKYNLNYKVTSDTYSSSLFSKNCLDEKTDFLQGANIYFKSRRFIHETKDIGDSTINIIHKLGFSNANESSICYKTLISIDDDLKSDSLLRKSSFSNIIGMNICESIFVLTQGGNPINRIVFFIKAEENGFKTNYLLLPKSIVSFSKWPILSQPNGNVLILMQLFLEGSKPYLYTTSISLKSIPSSISPEIKEELRAYFYQDRIYFRDVQPKGRFQVSNIMGQIMVDEPIKGASHEISHLPTGIYIAHIQQGNSIQRLKFYKP